MLKNLNLQLFDSLWLSNDQLLVGGGCGKAKTGFTNGLVLLDATNPPSLEVLNRAETEGEIAFSIVNHDVFFSIF